MKTGARLVVLSCLFFGGLGCGAASSPPAIDQLVYDHNPIAVGKQANLSGSFTFADSSGDARELNVTVQLPSGQSQALPASPIAGAAGQKSGTLTFALTVIPPVAGHYGFELWIVDGGEASNHLTGSFDAQ